MPDLDFRSLALWRELAEHVERWRAAQPRSRRRQSFRASDVPEHLRHLLATPARKRQSWRAYDEKSERWVDGAYTAGNPMDLTPGQLSEVVTVRREYALVRWGNYAGMGWVLRSDWRDRLNWLADPEGEGVLRTPAGR
jgi:hypothetical protein